jgi:5'-3' exonuclease
MEKNARSFGQGDLLMKVLVDAMNVVSIAFSVTKNQLRKQDEEFNEENRSFFYHMLLNKFNYLFKEYGYMTFAWEGEKSLEWRRSIFPDYKRNRDSSKAEDEYKYFISLMPDVKKLFSFYPTKHVEHVYAEGDDVIYALAEKYAKTENDILIISADNDLLQIKSKFPQVRIYNPIFKTSSKNKENVIVEKAITGDSSDGIPGLYRIGQKTFEKMMADSAKWNEVMKKNNNKEVFEKFCQIIDLSLFPENKRKEIQDLEENTNYNAFNPDSIELFLWENGLQEVLQRWTDLRNDIYRKIGEDPITQHFDTSFYQKANRENLEKTKEENDIDKIINDFV